MQADLIQTLRDRFLDAMSRALGDDLPAGSDPMIAPSKNPKFGDFQANAAMPLGKRLKRPPREVAEAIVAALELDDLAEPPTIAGPGFINVTLKTEAIGSALAAMAGGDLGVTAPERTETVIVDLCGVNLAKQMHVGHLRATVIGEAIARLWERLGHTVIRQNHFGDWGLPIAMVTHTLLEAERAGAIDLTALHVEDLERAYRSAQVTAAEGQKEMALCARFGLGPKAEAEWQEAYERGQAARAEARQALVRLQEGDAEYVRVWERISAVTLESCYAQTARLGVKDLAAATAGESTYRDELPEVVADLESRGVAVLDDGALVVRLEDMGIREPALIRKRDGGFLYATTDVAAIRRRVQKLGGERLFYAVDARQSLHFRQVFAAAEKAGYTALPDGGKAECVHAAFGTILGEDGTPFKTRSGDNVKLADLLDEAAERAGAAVAEKNPDLAADERDAIAEAVGIGAIKYADLSNDRVRDYTFSFDRMLSFEGDTGPYLQYALVRTRSMLRKAEERSGAAPDPGAAIVPEAPEEKHLALALLSYPGTLGAAAHAAEPHRLCACLYAIASAFSAFFAACPALGADSEAVRDSRLALAALTGRVLADGLESLGISAPARM